MKQVFQAEEGHLQTPEGKAKHRRLEELGVQCDLSTQHKEVGCGRKLERRAGPRWRGSWFRELRFSEG